MNVSFCLFQNKSSCENEFCRCKSYEWFCILENGLLDECRKQLSKKLKSEIQENKSLLVKCDAEVLMSKYGWLLTPFRWLNSFSGKIIL